MLPIILILLGIAVLAFGKRLAVLGAAVGALLGLALIHLFPSLSTPLLILVIPVTLAVIGFFVAGFAKGIVNIILLVIGALAGASIVLGFFDLFAFSSGWADWLLAIIGGVIGLILVRRFKDWAVIILASLVGGLLITRGLTIWLPVLEGLLGTLLVLVLMGGGILYQGGFLGSRKATTG